MAERTKNGQLPKITPLGITLYAVAVFLTAVIQSCLYKSFDFFGAIPSLALCLCCAAGYFDGENVGGTVGLCAGFLVDALGVASFSILPLAYALIGYFTGVFSPSGRIKLPAKSCFASFCVRLGIAVGGGSVTTLLGIFIGANSPNFIHAIVFVALPEAFITFVSGLFFWAAYRLIYIKRSSTGK